MKSIGITFSIIVLIGLILGATLVLRAQPEQPPASSSLPTTTVTIPVEGMSCASCAAHVKKTLRSIEGVTAVEVDLAQRAAHVSYSGTEVSPERLTAAINDLGYKAGTPTTERPQ